MLDILVLLTTDKTVSKIVGSIWTTYTLIAYPSLNDRDTLIIPAGLWFSKRSVARKVLQSI